MYDKYGLLKEDLKKFRLRDKKCVYCHKTMVMPTIGGRRSDWATIEHLNRLPPWNNSATVAICCYSCNASRSDKKLLDWFKSSYCKQWGINEKTVAQPVKEYLQTSGSKA